MGGSYNRRICNFCDFVCCFGVFLAGCVTDMLRVCEADAMWGGCVNDIVRVGCGAREAFEDLRGCTILPCSASTMSAQLSLL